MADKEAKPPTQPGTAAKPAATLLPPSVIAPPLGSKPGGEPKGGQSPPQDVAALANEGPTYVAEQNKQKSQNLAEAKDRAQLTVTTSMSVVHIALLKELLVAGPEHARFYNLSLGLLTTCLILQVIAGIIGLTTSYMKSFYSKYKGNACEDVISNICCCTISCPKRKDDTKSGKQMKKSKELKGKDNMALEDETTVVQPKSKDGRLKLSTTSIPRTMTVEEKLCKDEEEEPGCCPCQISTDIYPHAESDILYRYDNWVEQQLDINLQAAEATIHITRLKDIIKEAKEKLNTLENKKDDDVEEVQAQVQEINALLADAEKWKVTYEDFLWNRQVMKARGDLLFKQSNEIRQYHLLKTNTFWQQVLNYIFYTVFVLNAFITGLGIADNGFPAAAGATTTPPPFNSTT